MEIVYNLISFKLKQENYAKYVQVKNVFITWANNEGSGEPAHPYGLCTYTIIREYHLEFWLSPTVSTGDSIISSIA